MNELKPCPFCGNLVYLEKKPLWVQHPDGTTRGYYGCYEYDIHCDECGCRIKLPGNDTVYTTDNLAKENAIKTWNRRVNESKINEQSIFHGHWIGQPISGYADCKCSVCGAVCNVHACAGIPTQRYCYRCGALMLEDK